MCGRCANVITQVMVARCTDGMRDEVGGQLVDEADPFLGRVLFGEPNGGWCNADVGLLLEGAYKCKVG